MKKRWRIYADKIDALPLRQRASIFGAAVAVVLYFAFALFIEPAQKREKLLTTQMQLQRIELQTLQQQIQALESKRVDLDAANLARRDDIKRQIAEIDRMLKAMQQSLVPAQDMKAVLQEVLARNPRLQLFAVRTLPAAPLVEKRDKAEKSDAAAVPKSRDKPAASEGGVFKHGVQITVQGSYADLYDYLARLEKLSSRMFWSRASLSADDYPRLTLTVTIYTLSLDKAWLVV